MGLRDTHEVRTRYTAKDETKAATKGVSAGLASVATKAVAAAASVALVGGAIVKLVSASVSSAREIQAFNSRLGVSVEALQRLKFAAEQNNVAFTQLTMGMQRSTRRISEAAVGMGEAQDALVELNLSAAELNAMAPEDQFNAIAEALTGLTSQSDKVRLAFKLFDSEGVGLIQMFDKLGPTVAEAADQFDRLTGGPLSAGEIARLDEAAQAWGKFTTMLAAARNEATLLADEMIRAAIAADRKGGGGFVTTMAGVHAARVDRLAAEAAAAAKAKTSGQGPVLTMGRDPFPSIGTGENLVRTTPSNEGGVGFATAFDFEQPVLAMRDLETATVSAKDAIKELGVPVKELGREYDGITVRVLDMNDAMRESELAAKKANEAMQDRETIRILDRATEGIAGLIGGYDEASNAVRRFAVIAIQELIRVLVQTKILQSATSGLFGLFDGGGGAPEVANAVPTGVPALGDGQPINLAPPVRGDALAAPGFATAGGGGSVAYLTINVSTIMGNRSEALAAGRIIGSYIREAG